MWWQRETPPPPPEPTNPVAETALLIIGLFPALAVVWSVGTRSKTVAALAQLGGLQARAGTALWAALRVARRRRALKAMRVRV